jgi:hypothetical protein
VPQQENNMKFENTIAHPLEATIVRCVSLSLPLFMKPAHYLDEGKQTSPRQLRELADVLHETLNTAAKTLAILERAGWNHWVTLYSIDLESPVNLRTVEEAQKVLQGLGIDPRNVQIFDDEEDEFDDEHLDSPATQA